MNTDHGLLQACEATIGRDAVYGEFRDLPICQSLDNNECISLFSCFETQRFDAGETIYEANMPSDNTMRIIVEGAVSGSSVLHDSYIQLVAGDVFGLFSFLDEGRLHSATLKAKSDVVLLAINRDYFNLITIEDQQLGNQLLRFMFRLLSGMSLKLESEYAAMHHYITGRRV